MDFPKARWKVLRTLVQGLSFLAFLGWLVLLGREGADAWWVALPFQFDPLPWLTASLAGRMLLGGLGFALAAVVLSLLLGRVWCGWLCPMGSLFDLFPWSGWRPWSRPLPEGLRRGKYLLLIAILVGAIFSNQTLLILDPMTLVYRAFSLSIWPGLNHLISFLQRELYSVSIFRVPVQEIDQILRPEVFPETPPDIRLGGVYLGVLVGLVLLDLLESRFWCRYLCPLGGLLGWLGKAPMFRLQVEGTCSLCEMCIDRCPTGALQGSYPLVYDPAECTVCLECIEACPSGAAVLRVELPPIPGSRYDPSRRQVLSTLGLAVIGVGGMRLGRTWREGSSHPLRPPGVDEYELLSRCIRCALCAGICPTGALQPAMTEAGVEGFWTPVFIPRVGFCDYSCNACGRACPSNAIPALSLQEKQTVDVGKAFIDQQRCLAWADEENCIVCEEMCPLPEKAIRLEMEEGTDPEQDPHGLKRPVVDRDACIGCGICEYKCPVDGEAAIRVFPNSVDAVLLGFS